MIPPDAKNWTNEQIHLFSKWLQRRNHSVFCSIATIRENLEKLDFPFFFVRTKKTKSKINKKRTFLLAIGTKENKVAIRLRRHPAKEVKAGGLWTHQLTLILMVYANLIKMPTLPIDIGGQPTLNFCIHIWDKFLDYKLSISNLDK